MIGPVNPAAWPADRAQIGHKGMRNLTVYVRSKLDHWVKHHDSQNRPWDTTDSPDASLAILSNSSKIELDSWIRGQGAIGLANASLATSFE